MKTNAGKLLGWLAVSACCASLSGCAVIAWTVAAFMPPRKVPALYKPPKDQPMLVFVDDALNTADVESVKGPLARRLGELLKDRGVVSETIPHQRVLQLMAAESTFEQMPIARVGKRLGARTVLYVCVDRFVVQEYASPLCQGAMQTTVRVVDVEEGRLWPKDQLEGHRVGEVEIPACEETGVGYENTLTRQLADMMAERIVELFCDHLEPATTVWGE